MTASSRVLWSDITVSRVGDSIRLEIQRDETDSVELWIAVGGALQAATALLDVALGEDRAWRVEQRLRREFERAHCGALPEVEQSNFEEVLG